MNIAFGRRPSTWVIYCYRGPGRYAYDSKWRPRKPDAASGKLGATLDEWKRHESDQVSYCAFGDRSDKWFMRSTNGTTEWVSHLGPGAPPGLEWSYTRFQKQQVNKKYKNGTVSSASTIRAVTFGPGEAWILYSQRDFAWSESGLPSSLITALQEGRNSKWIINVGSVPYFQSHILILRQKAVLNPFDRNEYVLVYDNGPVYCSFDPSFRDAFRKIIHEWGNSMNRYKWQENEKVSVHWKDPAAVATESFSASKHGEEVEDQEGEYLKTSDGSPRTSFSSKEKWRPRQERNLSNEVQLSRRSSRSNQSSTNAMCASSEEPDSLPVTDHNEGGNQNYPGQATLHRTVSSPPYAGYQDHSSNPPNNFDDIGEDDDATHSQDFTRRPVSGISGISETPSLTNVSGMSETPSLVSVLESYEITSPVAPANFGGQAWAYQTKEDSRSGPPRVQSPTRRDGVRLLLSGKMRPPGARTGGR